MINRVKLLGLTFLSLLLVLSVSTLLKEARTDESVNETNLQNPSRDTSDSFNNSPITDTTPFSLTGNYLGGSNYVNLNSADGGSSEGAPTGTSPALQVTNPSAQEVSSSPSTTLISPADNSNSSSQIINFSASETSDGSYDLANATLFIWNYIGNLVSSSVHSSNPAITAQSCSANSNSASSNYASSCGGIYPSSCSSGGDRISCFDTYSESQSFGSMSGGWAGVKVNTHNDSVADCSSIVDVEANYVWWVSSSSGLSNAAVAVSNGTAEYIISSSNPPTSKPGITTINVTNALHWSCDDFFGPSASSYMRDQLRRNYFTSAILYTDLLSFNVTYLTPSLSLSQAISGLSNQTNWDFPALSDGVYTWNVNTCDANGNCNFAPANNTFSIDANSPLLSILYPLNTTYSTIETQLNFTASDLHLSSCWYSTNGGATNSSPNNCQSNFTDIISSDGQNNWTVYANDTLGNVNSATVSFFQMPSNVNVILISPSNKTYSNVFTQTFSANLTSGKQLSNASFYLWNQNGSLVNTAFKTVSGTSSPVSWAYTLPAGGTYSWNVKACDISGLCTFSPANYSFTVNQGAIVSFSRAISQQSDNAGQIGDVMMPLDNTTLQIYSGYQYGEVYSKGLRFQNVVIPKGALIINASITFKSSTEGGQGASTDIYGEKVDNSAPFSAANDNITSRFRTSSAVDYNNPPAPGGNTISVTTPDLTNIVSEITGRPGWASGNNMTFLFEPDPMSSILSETDTLAANPVTGAPILNIYYFIPTANPPVWKNQTTNISNNIVSPGGSITLSAYGYDNIGLHTAILSTNESGTWKNYTYNVIVFEDHDFWAGLNPPQNFNLTYKNITQTLINNGISQTLGVVPNSSLPNEQIYRDPQMLGYLRSLESNPSVEIAMHGNTHNDFEFQNLTTEQTLAKLQDGLSIFQSQTGLGMTPTTFIPPNGVYNNSAMSAYVTENFTRFSTYNYNDLNPYQYYPESLLHVSIDTDFMNWSAGTDHPPMLSSSYLENSCQTSLGANGICVFVLHFQNFANYTIGFGGNATFLENTMNTTEYQTLMNVVSWAKSQPDIMFKTVGQVTYFDLHDTPINLGDVGSTWIQSSFPWQNNSVPAGTTVGWRIYYTDTAGLVNATDIQTFMVGSDEILPKVSANYPANNSDLSSSAISFNATASDNYKLSNVSLYLDGIFNKTNSSGLNNTDYILAISGISNGNHSWFASACDSSNNCVNSPSWTFTVDTIMPLVSANSPANNTNSSNSGFAFDVTVSDNYKLSNVSLYLDGALKQTNISGLNNTDYAFTIQNISDGNHAWKAAACDSSNNCVNSSSFAFTIDTAAPLVSINSPANNSNISDFPVIFNATVSDNYRLSNVSLYLDGILNQTNSSGTNSTNYAFLLSGMFDGVHTWLLGACDWIGLCTNSSRNTFTLDITAPSVSITFPANNSNTSDNRVSINYTASSSVMSVSSCWYSSNSGTNITLPNCENITGVTWPEGANNVVIWANDTLGNTGSSGVSFTVDTVAPSVSILYPLNSTYNTAQTKINFTASDLHLSGCWYSANGGATNSSLNNCRSNFTGLSSSEGLNSWTVYANDSAGNIGSSGVIFTVDTIAPQWTGIPPNATITYPAMWSGAEFSASDAHLGLYKVNNSNFTINSSGYFNAAGVLGAGNYVVNISVNDTFGNTNWTLYQLTVNKAAPSMNLSARNATYPSSGTVNASASNPGGNDLIYNLYVDGVLQASGPLINYSKSLSAGSHAIIYNTSGGMNFTSGSSSAILVISRGIPSANITNDKAWAREWDGTNNLIGISEPNAGDSDVSYVLWRNNTNMGISDSIGAVGAYSYKVNTTGGINWTSADSMDTKILSIYNTVKPIITIPPQNNNISIVATSPLGAAIDYTLPTSRDVFNASVPVTCAPVSGSMFSIGKSNVSCSATDVYNNTGNAYFTVTVTAPTALPIITIPQSDLNISVTATSPSGASVSYSIPTAKDTFNRSVSVSCYPSSGFNFPIGKSNVSCSATDVYNNTGTASFAITILNPAVLPTITIPPEDNGISVVATSSSGAAVAYTLPTAKDLFNAPIPVTCAPASGSTFPVGTNPVSCSATDSYGNTGSSSFSITVTKLCTTVCNYGTCYTYCA